MKGWKTWTGGGAMVLTGVAMLLTMLSSGDFSDLTAALTTIAGGISVIGIGHKIEKAGL